MTDTETVDGELVEPGTDLEYRHGATPALFNTDDPVQIISKASRIADALKDVIVRQKMALRIGQSEYIKVEGWTTLGALVGVFPKVEWTRELTDGEGVPTGWEAAVVVVNGAGVEVGRAEAQCLRAEKNWKSRDDFALRSMAQTRAMGKALRMPLGWIAVMAGYEATPAEEMPGVTPSTQSTDVPFDDTGGQGPDSLPPSGRDSGEAHGNDPGTASSSTSDIQAALTELRDRLELLGADGEQAITDHAKRYAERPDLFARWIRRQIKMADEALEEKASGD